MARRQPGRRIRRAQGSRRARVASTRPSKSGWRGTGIWPPPGLTCLGWPVEHGGRGLSVAHRVAFYEEYAKADAPDKVNHLGEELLGPTLIAYGTPEQQKRFLPRSSTSPSCGARATPSPAPAATWPTSPPPRCSTATQWVINGQKVWTSLAHWAQWCFVVARTEKGSKRHAGPVLSAGAAGSAGRRDPPDHPADRRLGVQRGVLRPTPAPTPTWWSASPATAGGWRWARWPSSAACPRSASRSVTPVSFPASSSWPSRPARSTTR